ncbi:hypothetical protein Pelo_7425 [Pelomyxa schiedti]|nr:hypothetical protein Pelo_7425 [Pelomyxa schiedti]
MSNQSLMNPRFPEALNENLCEAIDYVVLPTMLTDKLHSWYGGDKPLLAELLNPVYSNQSLLVTEPAASSEPELESGASSAITDITTPKEKTAVLEANATIASKSTTTEPPTPTTQIPSTTASSQQIPPVVPAVASPPSPTLPDLVEVVPVSTRSSVKRRIPKKKLDHTRERNPTAIKIGWLELPLLTQDNDNAFVFVNKDDTVEHLKAHAFISANADADTFSIYTKKFFDPEYMWEVVDTYGLELTLSEASIDDCNEFRVGPKVVIPPKSCLPAEDDLSFDAKSFETLSQMVDNIEPFDINWPGKLFVGGHDALEHPEFSRRKKPSD